MATSEIILLTAGLYAMVGVIFGVLLIISKRGIARIDPAIHPFIADPIEINAEVSSWGGLNILNIRPDSIRRL
jgi:hypothetical protein